MSSATSTIEIYKSCKLLKDKNFVLDGSNSAIDYVSSYLGTLTKKTITGFQYIKHALSITIKVDLNQDYFQMKSSANDWNYVRIRNSELTASYFYYFVDKIEWGSENTAKFYLVMDTINTFKYNTDYKVNKKTLVKRMHKDRFIDLSNETFTYKYYVEKQISGSEGFSYSNALLGSFTSTSEFSYSIQKIASESNAPASGIASWSFSPATPTKAGQLIFTLFGGVGRVALEIKIIKPKLFLRVFDLKSEGISAPLYKIKDETIYEDFGRSTLDWKLFYKNASSADGAPVDCYLIPSIPTPVSAMSSGRNINYSDLTAGYYYYFCSKYYEDTTPDGFITFEAQNGDRFYPATTGLYNGVESFSLIVFYRASGENDFSIYKITSQGKFVLYEHQTYVRLLNNWDQISCYQTATYRDYEAFMANHYYNVNMAMNVIQISSGVATANIGNYIDRTDSTAIKLIDLPYLPTSHKLDDDGNGNMSYYLGTPWRFTNDNPPLIKYLDVEEPFSNDIISHVDGVNDNFLFHTYGQDLDGTADRFISDSKLRHSDFYRYKFVYDNFSKFFALEELEFNKEADYYFKFNFKVSRNICSKFLFTFNEINYKKSREDYDNILPVARNNEEVLYSSQYLNYLRNGYNFDVKAKQRQEDTAKAGLGLSVASVVASLLFASTPVGPLAIATAGIGLASQYINYAKTIASNEESIEQKLQESKNQAVSVLNNDDVDLFDAYSDNKAKICQYWVSDEMISVLDDLFYYAGYSVNKQMIPNVSSRYWFNFLQASLEVSETNNISEECMNDIKERFEQGVTFLHFHNGFDFGQTKENLEVDLVTS